MQTTVKYTRRTADEWQRLINDQRHSGLSAEAYCRQHGLGESTFYTWKARFEKDIKKNPSSTSFIELPALPAASVWDIELDLGAGIVLRLRRSS